jgi:hypothetical protein
MMIISHHYPVSRRIIQIVMPLPEILHEDDEDDNDGGIAATARYGSSNTSSSSDEDFDYAPSSGSSDQRRIIASTFRQRQSIRSKRTSIRSPKSPKHSYQRLPLSPNQAQYQSLLPLNRSSASFSQSHLDNEDDLYFSHSQNSSSGKQAGLQAVVCNCKRTRCLKLYCDCFRFKKYCVASHCNCRECANVPEFEHLRQGAVSSIVERNPEAFKPKILKSAEKMGEKAHLAGCHCKKSACLKKYCECYTANVPCSHKCCCINCKNIAGSGVKYLFVPSNITLVSIANLSKLYNSCSR